LRTNNSGYGIGGVFLIAILGFLFFIAGGCKAPARVFKIGVVGGEGKNTFEGFKAGMTELGYVEGKNVMYLHLIIPQNNDQKTGSTSKELMSQDIDLLLTMGGSPLQVRQFVKGDTPILFAGDAFPVESGLVQSLKHPGGNITGVKAAESMSKALEWLVRIADGAKKIYLPYEPDDDVAVMQLSGLNRAASQLGIELVLRESYSVEKTVAEIEDLPEDIDGIFLTPSRKLNQRSRELCLAALKRGIPTGAGVQLHEDVLVTLTNDFFDIGKKTARLAHQIWLGAKPADIPVETGEVSLTINLKTAEKIGILIQDNILAQATTIIR